jgi:alpha-L-arabinofuranosidase
LRTTIAVTVSVFALILGTTGPGSETNAAAEATAKAAARAVRGTAIVVDVKGDRGRAPTTLLGVNSQYDRNGRRLWNPDTNAPQPAVVNGAIRAGIQAMRFPGGTVANLYDWKRAIGDTRGCQVVGPQPNGPGFHGRAVTRGLDYGPDEFMTFMEQVGAKPNIMMPFVTETPGDAADWVEYMNGREGTNPNGGTAWADLRAANGHPAPYRIKWWEIGNEQHHANSRYWMSPNRNKALRQYLFGGSRVITGEKLGKNCAHPPAGIQSNAAASQTFEALYPPVDPQSFRLENGGEAWQRVSTSELSTAGPNAHVFTLQAETGRVTFGDGNNGAIPPSGSTVSATYRSVHQGYFAFARRMRAVDPSIRVCASWGAPAFNRAVHRRYDCLANHAIVQLTNGKQPTWSGPLEGHDVFMLKSNSVQTRIRASRRSMPRSTPLLLTEFVALHGDDRAFPTWGTSVSHAVYMSSLWAAWLNMRIPWGNGDDFLSAGGHRSVLGGQQRTFTADAVTREAIAPMFSAGGQVLTTRIPGNPVRRPAHAVGSYSGLAVAATRGDGVVRLLVVNRLPRKSVTSRIRLGGGHTRGTASIRSVTGPSFTSWNRPDAPPSVVLDTRSKRIGPTGFTYEFPASSTTVFRIPWRRR